MDYQEIKQKIKNCRNILVGIVPSPEAQVQQITIALMYKFMDDMDKEAQEKHNAPPMFFAGNFAKYAWTKLMSPQMSNQERMNLYAEALEKMNENSGIPQLFRDIFKGAFLPYRSPESLGLFLKEINGFTYDNSENLGYAFEHLLLIMGSQGDAGMFRTPRHIIDFIVDAVDPQKNENICDPACGTAGFLISAYNHIIKTNTKDKKGDLLSPEEKKKLIKNFVGYDISPDMVRLSKVNLYLHGFLSPTIFEYDTLSSEEKWDENFDVMLANPPFMSPKGGIRPHKRFSVRANRSEVLFVDYILEHLRPNGRAGIIVPEGIIFQSATAYKALRKLLVEDGLFAVVSLPAGVFNPYAGVKTSILLFDNGLAKKTKEILFLKIQNDGFDLGAQRREHNKNDLPFALEIIKKYKSALNDKDFEFSENEKQIAHIVAKEKIIAAGDYNLTGERYKEVVNYVNQKWPMVELGEICDLVRGITYGKDDEVQENGLKVLRANNINLDNSLNIEDIKQISKSVNLNEDKKLKKDDIFICLASGSKSHIGKVAFVENDTDYYFGGFMGVVRTNQEKKAISKYIFQQLKSSKFNDYLRKEISGVNINNLNLKILSSYKIPLPPLSVQKEIVEQIEVKQNAIDHAKAIIQNLERERRYFGQELRKLEGVEWVELGDSNIFEIESGGTPDTTNKEFWNGKINWATLADLSQDDYITELKETKRKITELGLSKSSAKLLPKDSILVSSRATIGRIAIAKEQTTTNQGFKNIIVKDTLKALPYFIAMCMASKTDEMKALATGGTFGEVSKSKMQKLKIPLPSLEIQKKLVAEAEKEQEIINANKQLIEIMEQKIKDVLSEIWI